MPTQIPSSTFAKTPTPNPSNAPPFDSSFQRYVSLLESPPVGTGILSLAVFFFIAFLSDPLLAKITLRTLGITVTISTFWIMGIIIFILILI